MTAILDARRRGDIGTQMNHLGVFETIDVAPLLKYPDRTLGITIECETDEFVLPQSCGIKPTGGLQAADFVDVILQATPESATRRQCTITCSLTDGGGGAKTLDMRSPDPDNHFYIVAEWGEGFRFLNNLYSEITFPPNPTDTWTTIDATGVFGADAGNVEAVIVRAVNVVGTQLIGLRPTATDGQPGNATECLYALDGPQPNISLFTKVDDDNTFQVFMPSFPAAPVGLMAIQGWVLRDHGLRMRDRVHLVQSFGQGGPMVEASDWKTLSTRHSRVGPVPHPRPFAPVTSSIVLASYTCISGGNNRICGLKSVWDYIDIRQMLGGSIAKPIELDHAQRQNYLMSPPATTARYQILGDYFPHSVRPFENGAVRKGAAA